MCVRRGDSISIQASEFPPVYMMMYLLWRPPTDKKRFTKNCQPIFQVAHSRVFEACSAYFTTFFPFVSTKLLPTLIEINEKLGHTFDKWLFLNNRGTNWLEIYLKMLPGAKKRHFPVSAETIWIFPRIYRSRYLQILWPFCCTIYV